MVLVPSPGPRGHLPRGWPKARLLQHLPHGLDGDGLEDSAQTTRCHTEAPAGDPGTKYQPLREPAH